jgi:hypothetical protein
MAASEGLATKRLINAVTVAVDFKFAIIVQLRCALIGNRARALGISPALRLI